MFHSRTAASLLLVIAVSLSVEGPQRGGSLVEGFLVDEGSYRRRRHASPSSSSSSVKTALRAKASRYADNVEGPLYVNDRCINCAACSMFAPDSFARSDVDGHHIVHTQPQTEQQIEQARAALSACPVAAIRVESLAERRHNNLPDPSPEEQALAPKLALNPKFNNLELPFPRPISPSTPDIYHVGHHNEHSFGAAPYLVQSSSQDWILVDSPRFSKTAVTAIEKVTGPNGPKYMLLTHVDDTADHSKWKDHYPNLKRIFHALELNNNWVGDKSLEEVEILLQESSSDEGPLQLFSLDGTSIDTIEESKEDVVLIHTPGHSLGSLTLYKKPSSSEEASRRPGVIFTGDTYAYSTRDNGHMSGFPRYGRDLNLQATVLPRLLDFEWQIVAPGHGHVRDYPLNNDDDSNNADRTEEMQPAVDELKRWGGRRRS